MSLSALEQTDLVATIEREGWAVTPPVVPQLEIDRLIEALSPLAAESLDRGGTRNLFELAPSVKELARAAPVRSVAEAVLGAECFAVRAILFDKTPAANWRVTWHQDLTIAVRHWERMLGWGPWSEKAGIPHVHAPIELLERMLTVRVHLDDCGTRNGPVRVLPGSHRVGRLSPTAIDAWRRGAPWAECLAERGSLLAMRPLLLHASSPALEPAHRRVVHLEFAAEELPEPLMWHARVS